MSTCSHIWRSATLSRWWRSYWKQSVTSTLATKHHQHPGQSRRQTRVLSTNDYNRGLSISRNGQLQGDEEVMAKPQPICHIAPITYGVLGKKDKLLPLCQRQRQGRGRYQPFSQSLGYVAIIDYFIVIKFVFFILCSKKNQWCLCVTYPITFRMVSLVTLFLKGSFPLISSRNVLCFINFHILLPEETYWQGNES